MVATETAFNKLLAEVKTCTICADHLLLGPNPVLQIHPDARILVAGQAPGIKVHQSSIPFQDASGDRLRDWMGIDKTTFYDPTQIAILPMGFCYPGKGASGDLPPRPECAETWRNQLLANLPNIQLTLVIGQYAQQWHLGTDQKANLTETVKNWADYWPKQLPLPHPSPRNNIWLKKNPWFEQEVLPTLKTTISDILNK
ncbi:MAG: uracil-DNA glycosylase family protein [Vampirovibrio sp.]|nr:uracil-DNA glycosylase family protein [Vampirovibrio sp.]